MVAKPDMTYNTAKRRIKASGITTMMSPMFSSCFLAAKKLKLSTTNLQTPPSPKIDVRAPGLSHITRRKVTSPNGIARWRKVTSHGGKSHHFATIPMAQRHSTENRKVTKSSRDIAHSEIFVDFRKKFASNTNGTACAI